MESLADVIRNRSVCVFVGAGASASAGVPTFRGHSAAQSLLAVREDHLIFPNFTSRAIAALLEQGLVQGVVSSNHDGLVASACQQAPDEVVEIFGCVLTEVCLKCSTRFRRKFAPPALNRACEECGGKLKKSGCRYGQQIYKPGLDKAEQLASSSDVALILGSGMHTWPLSKNGFPSLAKKQILVTLGSTAADGADHIERFNQTTDSFMRELCGALNVEVKPHVFEQEFQIDWTVQDGRLEVMLHSPDPQEALVWVEEAMLELPSGREMELDRSNVTLKFRLETAALADGKATLRMRPKEELEDGECMMVDIDVSQPQGCTRGKYMRLIADHEQ